MCVRAGLWQLCYVIEKGQGVMAWSWLALMDTLMGGLDEKLIEWATAEHEEEERAALLLWEDSNSLAKLTAQPLKGESPYDNST